MAFETSTQRLQSRAKTSELAGRGGEWLKGGFGVRFLLGLFVWFFVRVFCWIFVDFCWGVVGFLLGFSMGVYWFG